MDMDTQNVKNAISSTVMDKKIEAITDEISYTSERKRLSYLFNELAEYGVNAEDELISYLSDTTLACREFACNILGKTQSNNAVIPIINLLNVNEWRVRNSATVALAEIRDKRAIDPIMKIISNLPEHDQSRYYNLIGSFKIKQAWPILVAVTKHPNWYSRISAIRALTAIDEYKAMPFAYAALKDENKNVRRQMVFLILEIEPIDGTRHLEKMVDNNDFETAFYAEQAISKIMAKSAENK